MERSTVHLLYKRGKSLRQIASELGRSKNTVARALAEPVDRQPSTRRRKSSVDVFREQIVEWLEQGLSGVRMMELAREDPDHPYGGCGSVWRAAVRRERLSGLHEQAVADVPIRFEGLPGEYLQVDWGEIRHFPFTQQTPRDALLPGVSAEWSMVSLALERHVSAEPFPEHSFYAILAVLVGTTVVGSLTTPELEQAGAATLWLYLGRLRPDP